MTFEEAVSKMIDIRIAELTEKIKSEDVVVFVGRPTCPYCQLFAPKLAQAIDETNQEVYYLMSDTIADIEAIQDFRSRYHIATVPGLFVMKEGQARVVCDSSMSVEAIKAFMA
ncbi:thioredoxin domain-containing protein [Streptococcus sp. zg-JUN1979]|uniref:thioredoxin domain-containing protein n=1 Tax=Streptococcus sp. zg-JUN1979 TaxID=3391450 RepID=UPI0039A45571